VSLGEAGATVYCTGRSVRGRPAGSRPETIDETAEMVSARGGVGIAMRVDHSEPEEVRALAERVRAEQGRLDVLVNDIWGGDELTAWDKPFWEHSLEDGLLMQRRAVHTHIITSHSLAPLMVARGAGLIIEITDGDSLDYYRGNLFYDLAKVCAIRLGYAMAQELEPHHVTAVALTPDSCGRRRCSTISASARRTGGMRRPRNPHSPAPRPPTTSGGRWRRWRRTPTYFAIPARP